MASTSGTLTPGFLSASTNGRMISVTATSSSGSDLLHTASAAGTIDVVTLYATHVGSGTVTLTIQWGGTTDDDEIEIQVPNSSAKATKIVDRWRISGALEVRAFVGSGEVLIYGHVNELIL